MKDRESSAFNRCTRACLSAADETPMQQSRDVTAQCSATIRVIACKVHEARCAPMFACELRTHIKLLDLPT